MSMPRSDGLVSGLPRDLAGWSPAAVGGAVNTTPHDLFEPGNSCKRVSLCIQRTVCACHTSCKGCLCGSVPGRLAKPGRQYTAPRVPFNASAGNAATSCNVTTYRWHGQVTQPDVSATSLPPGCLQVHAQQVPPAADQADVPGNCSLGIRTNVNWGVATASYQVCMAC